MQQGRSRASSVRLQLEVLESRQLLHRGPLSFLAVAFPRDHDPTPVVQRRPVALAEHTRFGRGLDTPGDGPRVETVRPPVLVRNVLRARLEPTPTRPEPTPAAPEVVTLPWPVRVALMVRALASVAAEPSQGVATLAVAAAEPSAEAVIDSDATSAIYLVAETESTIATSTGAAVPERVFTPTSSTFLPTAARTVDAAPVGRLARGETGLPDLVPATTTAAAPEEKSAAEPRIPDESEKPPVAAESSPTTALPEIAGLLAGALPSALVGLEQAVGALAESAIAARSGPTMAHLFGLGSWLAAAVLAGETARRQLRPGATPRLVPRETAG